MKMFMMLTVATILFCSLHQAIVAREVVINVNGNMNNLLPCWPIQWPWCPSPPQPPTPSPPPSPTSCSTSDQEKIKTCMFNTTSIDECCPIFKSTLGTSCPCYNYADGLDNQVLITLDAYCDIDSPCKSVQSSPPPALKAPALKSSCPVSDQEKLKKCFFETTLLDDSCPIFMSIVNTNCACYKYAEDLDDQIFLTLNAYCGIYNDCDDVQVIKLFKEE